MWFKESSCYNVLLTEHYSTYAVKIFFFNWTFDFCFLQSLFVLEIAIEIIQVHKRFIKLPLTLTFWHDLLSKVLDKEKMSSIHFITMRITVFNKTIVCGRRCLAALKKSHKIQQNEIERIRGIVLKNIYTYDIDIYSSSEPSSNNF